MSTPSASSIFPSHRALDHNNRSRQNFTFAVFDNLTVDALSSAFLLSAFLLRFLFSTSFLTLCLYLSLTILPLRLFFYFSSSSRPYGELGLITGASSGIGAELSYLAAASGNDLILVGRNADQLEKVRQIIMNRYGTQAWTIVKDLSLPGAAKELYAEAKSLAAGRPISLLLNNAAAGHGGDFMEHTAEMYERMITLNVVTLASLTELFAKDMVKRSRGWILQTSSVAGWMPSPGQSLYNATKHAVRVWTEEMTVELRGTGVRICQLMPGPVHTNFAKRASLERQFVFSFMPPVENPKDVAAAGWEGLIRGRHQVYSSYNAAMMATMGHYLPRSWSLMLGRLMNTPTPNKEMETPIEDQGQQKIEELPNEPGQTVERLKEKGREVQAKVAEKMEKASENLKQSATSFAENMKASSTNVPEDTGVRIYEKSTTIQGVEGRKEDLRRGVY